MTGDWYNYDVQFGDDLANQLGGGYWGIEGGVVKGY